ncbi:MAG: nuclear transport factor 2 family protein, partial [Maribacter sp.]|nr:nuclear transport factor 2 family protein [Maribacter sp.]
MALGKKQKAALMLVYEAYWGHYLKGEVAAIPPLLDASYTQVGSAESEVFSTKKEAVQFLRDTIDEVSGKLEMRNRSTRLEQQGDLVLIHELCDLYALADKDWVFYSKFRATTLLQEKKEGWKITHQHSSFPDAKTDAGQNVAIDRISEENRELREAVKRRTIELEEKNRELAIEASLERVRGRAMAMHTSEELIEVATLLHQEIKKIGFAQTLISSFVIIDEENKTQKYWGAVSDTGLLQQINLPLLGDKILKDRYEAWKRKEPIFYQKVGGARLKKHLETTMPKRFASKEVNDAKTAMPDPTYFYFANFSYGSISLLNSTPFTADEESLMPRYAKVFEQTYTRFLDLQKAEAQAREAEIELGLERVRARAMAMHRGDELAETSMILFNQLLALGFKPRACGFLIMDEKSQTMDDWSANVDAHGKGIHINSSIDFDQHPIIRQVVDAWQKGNPYFIGGLHGEELQKYYNAVTLKETASKSIKEKVLSVTTSEYTNSFYFEYGMMYVLTTIPLTDHEINVLLRFSGVLKLTYRRFLDLQKAEAQAREAQIETALERIRAKAMAMRTPDDLKAVAIEVRQQIEGLGQFELETSVVHLYEKGSSNFESLAAIPGPSGDIICLQSFFPVDATMETQQMMANYWAGKKEYTLELTRKKARQWQKIVLENNPDLGSRRDEIINNLKQPDQPEFWNFADYSGGSLLLVTHAPMTPKTKELLRRSANVFDLAYRRYQDLVNAEAQAREAQIETALERVRSRTMGMQKSTELEQVVNELTDQFRMLKTETVTCWIALVNAAANTMEIWNYKGESLPKSNNTFNGKDHYTFQADIDAFKKKQPFRQFSFEKQAAQKILKEQKLFELVEIPEQATDYHLLQCRHNFGFLGYSSWKNPDEEGFSLLQRFCNVFNQTYTRFLDLQKAEAQAREAQIEAALERIRTRTMAMHHSGELSEVAVLLHQEIRSLGTTPFLNCGYVEVNQNEKIQRTWMSSNDGTEMEEALLPLTGDALFDKRYKAWKKQEPIFHQSLADQALTDHFEFAIPYFKSEERVILVRTKFPKTVHFYCANFPQGYLHILSGTPLTSEEEQLIVRLTGVFEMTYNRFLDLKKAEAQAREAQIEAALERVRSRTMAMHKSEELLDAGSLLYHELLKFGISNLTSGYCLMEADEKIGWNYIANQIDGTVLPKPMGIPHHETDVMRSIAQSWKKQDPFHIIQLNEAETILHQTFIAERTINFNMTAKELIARTPKRLALQTFNFKQGYLLIVGAEPLLKEQVDMLVRFAKVFEMTYQRFLDLQKAEAQAREAQIEAALERVRSKTMAMHNSKDVGGTVVTLFDEVIKLGLDKSIRCGIGILEGTEKMETWSAASSTTGEVDLKMGLLNMTIHPMLVGVRNAWESRETQYSYEFKGKDVTKYYTALNKEPDYPFQVDVSTLPDNVYHNSFFFTEGFLFAFTWSPLTEEATTVLRRFAGVFGQTYRRYLDLLKAEAQAREAQIEAALEKVRSQSLAMHTTSEMQQVANAVYEQLNALGLEMDAVGMSGVIEAKQDYDVWIGGSSFDKPLRIPFNDATQVQRDYNQAIESRSELFARTYSGEIKKEYTNHLLSHGSFPENLKKRMLKSDAFSTSISFAKNSSIQIARYTGQPYSDNENEILKRFAKVFEQAYIRFRDIEKAELQAREAQIEAALEKVRSRTMAMHKSEELGEVAAVMFEQISLLTHTPDRFNIGITNEEDKSFDIWVTDQKGHEINRVFVAKADKSPIIASVFNARKHKKTLVLDLYGKRLKEWVQYMNKEVGIPFNKGQVKEHRFINSVFFSHGFIGVTTNKPLEPETLELIERFAKVFQQTYVRFLDLQKAESQAREAQIEASLERIRASTMAMHQSNELSEVLTVLFDQFDILGINPVFAHLSLIDLENNTFTYRMTGRGGKRVLTQQVIDLNARKEWKDIVEGFKTGKLDDVTCLHFTKESVPQIWELFDETFNSLPKGAKIYQKDFPDGIYNTQGLCKFGYIGFNHNRPATEEEKEIVVRFGKEFGRLYQRYLDIEKAEAQAKEAQIEAALEKVRSRSLAMHSPDELQEVVTVVGEKLQELGVILDTGGVVICTYYPDSKDVMHWTASFDATHPSVPYYLPYFDTPIFIEAWASKNSGADFFEKVFSFKDKNHFFLHAFEHSDYKNLPEEYKKELLAVKSHALSFAWSKNSALMVPSHNGKLLPEEHKSILKRFAKVFEQAYIRFMDLQKAEAQARESKIEMALEKVRSRTMAMHKSEELGEVAAVLFEQISTLTYAPERFNIAIGNKEEESFDIWVTDQKGHEVSKRFMFQVDKSPVVREVFNAWEKEPYIVQDLHGKKLQEWVRYMQEEIGLPFDEARLSDHRYINSVFFSHGCIGITTNEPPEAEILELIGRFAKVFQQTYVRFLDLQKAEAQARESQIEVALERVRSRAMAMHHSDELTEVLGVLFDQFDFLGINPVLTHLTLMDEENETFTLRITRGGKDRTIAEQRIDINAVESWKTSFANWKNSEQHAIDCIDYPQEVLPAVWELLNEVMNALPEGQKIYPEDFPNGFYTTQGHCKYGYIGFNHSRRATEEEKEIVIRFAKEFGRLYQRFLDIQKAEVQAREAQVEAALERVRSRSMAMQHSSELNLILAKVFEDLTSLELEMERA